MVFYTDGVTEARGVNGFYGNDRLTTLVAAAPAPTADALADALLADVVGFQQGRLHDDVATAHPGGHAVTADRTVEVVLEGSSTSPPPRRPCTASRRRNARRRRCSSST